MTLDNRKFGLMILAGSTQQYHELISYIPFDNLGLYLLPCMPESQDPFDSLQLLHPDIVIVDEVFLSSDTIKHIQRLFPSRFANRFIILYDGKKDIPFISDQLSASASIEKTNLRQTLPLYLQQAIKRLKWNREPGNFVYEATRLYFNTVYLQSISATQSVETVNESFGFTFQPGLFRVIIVKLDCFVSPQSVYGKLFPLQKKIEEALYAHLLGICHEIILCRTFDGVIATLNYAKEAGPQVSTLIRHAFEQIRTICSAVSEISTTFCLGDIYDTIGGVCRSRVDAHNVLWGRLVLGHERILCSKDCAPLQFPRHLDAKYETLRFRVLKAFETLDIPSFSICVDEIFDSPDFVLGSPYIADFLHSLILEFFRIHNDEISRFSNVETLKNKTIYVLIMAPTLKNYRSAFVAEFSDMMYQITLQKNKSFSSHVQNAISYIKDNYAQSITLSDIAENIGISTSYLSSTFKAETGTGLSNYISFIRLQNACRMLRDTNDPISLIAAKVNIGDTTYFSKQFRKYVGTTPSEYRKIFQ